jgi:hypothetical protein
MGQRRIGQASLAEALLPAGVGSNRRLERKRGDETRLSVRLVDVLDRPGSVSFELKLWSTLMTTRRVAVIGVSRF